MAFSSQDNTAREGIRHVYVLRKKMEMYRKYRNFVLLPTLAIAMFLLAGCSLFGGGAGNSSAQTGSATSDGNASPTVISQSTVDTNKPGTGPIVIQSPTPVVGGSASAQQLGLPDRTIVIESVSKQAGSTADSMSITLKLTFKNTSNKDIKNLATSYHLVGTEGDMFGLQAGSSNDFFGTIPTNTVRSGTIVFEGVPSGAIKKLQLLYRSESSQVIFAPLNV